MQKKYSTIVIDPPWSYGAWDVGSKNIQGGVTKRTPLPYSSLTIDEIKSLPIQNIASENCELYLWTTQKYLPVSFEIISHWRFKYCQTLIWCKKPMGTGQGGVYCPTTEFLILARKGKMPLVKRIDSTWWLIKRQKKHSTKPEFFQDMIERVTVGPRLEMFARRPRKGWDVFGNEVENSIDISDYSESYSITPLTL